MALKSRDDVEANLIVASVKAGFSDLSTYLNSLGWDGPVKDYIDVQYISQKSSIASHFVIAGLIMASLVGLIIFGVNVTGNAIDSTADSAWSNSLIGLFLFLLALFFLILRHRNLRSN